MKKYLVFIYTLIGFVAFAQKTHTVAKGDTPYNISKKYGVTLDELTKLNPQIRQNCSSTEANDLRNYQTISYF